MDYPDFRRLEQAVIDTAREHGYDGQLFAERPLPLGTRDEEMAAVYLSLSISPRPRTIEARRLAREWTRNIVLSSAQPAVEKTLSEATKKSGARKW